MIIKDVMSDRVIRVNPDSGLQEIAIAMRDGDLGSIPVEDDDKLIGMVTDRDIVIRGLTGTLEVHLLTARDVMSPNVKYCFEDQSVSEVLENMGDERIRRLPESLCRCDVEIQQAGQRQVDKGDFFKGDAFVDAPEFTEVGFRQGKRRQSPKSAPLFLVKLKITHEREAQLCFNPAGSTVVLLVIAESICF